MSEEEGGLVAHVTLHGTDYAAFLRSEQQKGQRSVPGRSGCGICGVRTLDEARRVLPLAPAGAVPSLDAIGKALGVLQQADTARVPMLRLIAQGMVPSRCCAKMSGGITRLIS